jgi:hypothetical protein
MGWFPLILHRLFYNFRIFYLLIHALLGALLGALLTALLLARFLTLDEFVGYAAFISGFPNAAYFQHQFVAI